MGPSFLVLQRRGWAEVSHSFTLILWLIQIAGLLVLDWFYNLVIIIFLYFIYTGKY